MCRIKRFCSIVLLLLGLQLSSQEMPVHNTYEAPDPKEEAKKPYVIGGGAVAVVVASIIAARRRRKRRLGR